MNDQQPRNPGACHRRGRRPGRLHRGPPARRLRDPRHPAGTPRPAPPAAPRGAPDEVTRILDRIGVSEGFLARSRPGSGLRLLDAGHRVMAEFSRDYKAGVNGFPQANMFHQPDLEELLLARVAKQPLIDFRRGAEVVGIEGTASPLTGPPVRVRTLVDEEPQTST